MFVEPSKQTAFLQFNEFELSANPALTTETFVQLSIPFTVAGVEPAHALRLATKPIITDKTPELPAEESVWRLFENAINDERLLDYPGADLGIGETGYHNHELMANAFKLLQDRQTRFYLYVVGRAIYRDDSSERVTEICRWLDSDSWKRCLTHNTIN